MVSNHGVSRPVSKTAAFVVLVFFLCCLQACKEQEVDPGFGPNGEPRVLAVQIPDIPDQNIQIDQDKKQIIVTVPTSFSADYIRPTLSLTPSTTTASGLSYALNAVEDASNYPLFIITKDNKSNSYTFVLKPIGDLVFGTLSGPQTYSLGSQDTYLCLPVYNYVDGAGYQNTTVALVNKQTGERIVVPNTLTDRISLCNRTPRTDGAVMVTAYLNGFLLYYRPGDYTVELTKPNGRKTTLAQPVQLLKSVTEARFDVNYTLKLNSGDYLLYGANFYQDDKYSVRIQGRGQPDITVDALGFIDKQPGIRLPTSLNLKPGYYYAQLLVNGVPTSSTSRISISDQTRPLLLQSISLPNQTTYKNLLGESYSFDSPTTLQKEVNYAVNTNYYLFTSSGSNEIRQAQLTLLDDISKVYTVPFGKSQTSSSDGIIFPATLPAGRYQLRIQLVRTDGTVVDGLPLERDVVIQ